MLEALLNLPVPIFDQVFAAWGIPAAFSKLVLIFSLVAAVLISRLSVSSAVIVIPTAFLFLVFCAIGAHWMLQDVQIIGQQPIRKIMMALLVGQSFGGLLMMAFFKTGNKRAAGL